MCHSARTCVPPVFRGAACPPCSPPSLQDGLTHSLCVKQCNLRAEKPPAFIKCISYQHGMLCSTSPSMLRFLLRPSFGVVATCCPEHQVTTSQQEGKGRHSKTGGVNVGIRLHGCAPGECKPLQCTAPFGRPGERIFPSFPMGFYPHGAASHLFGAEGRPEKNKK